MPYECICEGFFPYACDCYESPWGPFSTLEDCKRVEPCVDQSFEGGGGGGRSGACCLGTDCLQTSEEAGGLSIDDCSFFGGFYHGDDTSCDSVTTSYCERSSYANWECVVVLGEIKECRERHSWAGGVGVYDTLGECEANCDGDGGGTGAGGGGTGAGGGGGSCPALPRAFIGESEWAPKESACHSACAVTSLWEFETEPTTGDSQPSWEVSNGGSTVKYTAVDSQEYGGKGTEIQAGKAARMFQAEEDFTLTVRMLTNHESRITHDTAEFKIYEIAACCTGVCDPIVIEPESCCARANDSKQPTPDGDKVGKFWRWPGRDGLYNCPCGYAQADPFEKNLLPNIPQLLFTKGESEKKCGEFMTEQCSTSAGSWPNHCPAWNECIIQGGRWRCNANSLAAGGCTCECVQEKCYPTEAYEMCDSFSDCDGCFDDCGCGCKQLPNGKWVEFKKYENEDGDCVFDLIPVEPENAPNGCSECRNWEINGYGSLLDCLNDHCADNPDCCWGHDNEDDCLCEECDEEDHCKGACCDCEETEETTTPEGGCDDFWYFEGWGCPTYDIDVTGAIIEPPFVPAVRTTFKMCQTHSLYTKNDILSARGVLINHGNTTSCVGSSQEHPDPEIREITQGECDCGGPNELNTIDDNAVRDDNTVHLFPGCDPYGMNCDMSESSGPAKCWECCPEGSSNKEGCSYEGVTTPAAGRTMREHGGPYVKAATAAEALIQCCYIFSSSDCCDIDHVVESAIGGPDPADTGANCAVSYTLEDQGQFGGGSGPISCDNKDPMTLIDADCPYWSPHIPTAPGENLVAGYPAGTIPCDDSGPTTVTKCLDAGAVDCENNVTKKICQERLRDDGSFWAWLGKGTECEDKDGKLVCPYDPKGACCEDTGKIDYVSDCNYTVKVSLDWVPNVDLDLYVRTESMPGNAIYYSNPSHSEEDCGTSIGLSLSQDRTSGLGPDNPEIIEGTFKAGHTVETWYHNYTQGEWDDADAIKVITVKNHGPSEITVNGQALSVGAETGFNDMPLLEGSGSPAGEGAKYVISCAEKGCERKCIPECKETEEADCQGNKKTWHGEGTTCDTQSYIHNWVDLNGALTPCECQLPEDKGACCYEDVVVTGECWECIYDCPEWDPTWEEEWWCRDAGTSLIFGETVCDRFPAGHIQAAGHEYMYLSGPYANESLCGRACYYSTTDAPSTLDGGGGGAADVSFGNDGIARGGCCYFPSDWDGDPANSQCTIETREDCMYMVNATYLGDYVPCAEGGEMGTPRCGNIAGPPACWPDDCVGLNCCFRARWVEWHGGVSVWEGYKPIEEFLEDQASGRPSYTPITRNDGWPSEGWTCQTEVDYICHGCRGKAWNTEEECIQECCTIPPMPTDPDPDPPVSSYPCVPGQETYSRFPPPPFWGSDCPVVDVRAEATSLRPALTSPLVDVRACEETGSVGTASRVTVCGEKSEEECAELNGEYKGDGTECEEDTCPETVGPQGPQGPPEGPQGPPEGAQGACCVEQLWPMPNYCSEQTEEDCLAGNGEYKGDGTQCGTAGPGNVFEICQSDENACECPCYHVEGPDVSTTEQGVCPADWPSISIDGVYGHVLENNNNRCDQPGGCYGAEVNIILENSDDYGRNLPYALGGVNENGIQLSHPPSLFTADGYNWSLNWCGQEIATGQSDTPRLFDLRGETTTRLEMNYYYACAKNCDDVEWGSGCVGDSYYFKAMGGHLVGSWVSTDYSWWSGPAQTIISADIGHLTMQVIGKVDRNTDPESWVPQNPKYIGQLKSECYANSEPLNGPRVWPNSYANGEGDVWAGVPLPCAWEPTWDDDPAGRRIFLELLCLGNVLGGFREWTALPSIVRSNFHVTKLEQGDPWCSPPENLGMNDPNNTGASAPFNNY